MPIVTASAIPVSEPTPFAYHRSSSIVSDIFGDDRNDTRHGVFFVSDSTNAKSSYRYWMNDYCVWDDVCHHFMLCGYDTFSFLPYSSRDAFQRDYPSCSLHPDEIIISQQNSVAQVSDPLIDLPNSPPQAPASEIEVVRQEINNLRAQVRARERKWVDAVIYLSVFIVHLFVLFIWSLSKTCETATSKT